MSKRWKSEKIAENSFAHEPVDEDCLDCHDPHASARPGLFRESVHAPFEAGDCTSCHAGEIVYINDDAGNITFSHDAHLDMFGCEECHPDLFKPERGTNLATMEEMENGQSCGACHDGSTAFSVAGDCEACHEM